MATSCAAFIPIIVAYKPWLINRGTQSAGLKDCCPMPADQTPTRTIEEVREDIARNLKAYRLMRALAQETLALEADVDRTMVSKIERGITNPSIATLLKLANRLGIQISDLLREH